MKDSETTFYLLLFVMTYITVFFFIIDHILVTQFSGLMYVLNLSLIDTPLIVACTVLCILSIVLGIYIYKSKLFIRRIA